MKHPGITVAEPGTLLAKTWRKLVGQVRVQERFFYGKRVSFFAYIDYGVTSRWRGQ